MVSSLFRDPRLARLLALAWMAMIFHLSSQPSLPISTLFAGQDKFMHLLAYSVLGLLLGRSLNIPGGILSWRQAGLAILMTLVYGLSDEFHQSFVPGRDASLGDLAADGLGGLLGALVLRRAGSRLFYTNVKVKHNENEE